MGGICKYLDTLIEKFVSSSPVEAFSTTSIKRDVPGFERTGCRVTVTNLPFGFKSLGRELAKGSKVYKSVMAMDIVIISKPLQRRQLVLFEVHRTVIKVSRETTDC